MANTSVLDQIIKGVEGFGKDVENIWDNVVKEVEGDVATIEKAFPGTSTAVAALASAVKQGASDALGIGATILGDAQPAIITGVNAAADSALLALTGGAATPAIPAFNNWIDGVVNAGNAALQAWALKQKALLASSATKTN